MEEQSNRFKPGMEVIHPHHGSGWVVSCNGDRCTVDFSVAGQRTVLEDTLEVPGDKPSEVPMTLDRVKKALREVLAETVGPSEEIKIADRWRGGTLVMRSKNPELKDKEVPLETFFHKIVMVRERLRVLEQRVNTHPKLDDSDRVEMQEYITRAYGSLTTFNVLFANREDAFVGQKGDKGSRDVE